MTPSLNISDSADLPQADVNTTGRSLACISGLSRPKPTLTWYRNGVPLGDEDDTRGFTIFESYTEQHPDLFIVKSILTMSTDWYEDLDVFTCQASNDVDAKTFARKGYFVETR